MSGNDNNGLIAAIGTVEALLVLLGTYAFIRHYALPTVKWPYYLTVFVAYFWGFGGTILIPIDIALTDKIMQSSDAGEEEGNFTLKYFWAVSYWITWIVAWIIVPILQEYWAAGQFTFKSKMKASLKANLKAFGVGLVISIVALVWMAIKSENPFDVLMGLSNFYALILIVLLMSYGMVEVPRSFWRARSPENLLRLVEFRAADVDMRLFEAEETLKDVMKRVQQASQTMRNERDTELQRCWAVVTESVTLDVPERNSNASRTSAWAQADPLKWKIEKLAKLNFDLRMASVRHTRAQTEWTRLLKEAEDLENIINKVSAPSSSNAASALGESSLLVMLRSWRWNWRVHVAPRFNFAMTIVTAIMSALLLWCEITIPVKHRLSIFGEIVRGTDAANVVGVQFLSLVPLSYATWCTYSSLVKLKIPFIDALTFHDNQMTDSYALLFNAGYVSRLQFGLGANFLMMLQYDESSDMWPTAFRDFVGKMNVDVLGESFAYVFPMSMLVVVFLLYFKFYDRALTLLGVDLYVGMGEPLNRGPEYMEKLKEGQMLIRTGRRKKERMERGRTQQRAKAGPSDRNDNTGASTNRRRGEGAGYSYADSKHPDSWARVTLRGGERYTQLSDDEII